MRQATLVLILFLTGLSYAGAESLPPDTPLVSRGDAVVTARDFEAALQAISPEYRSQLANSPTHISDLIAQLLENRLLAIEARKRELGEKPLIQAQVQLKAEQVLATELLERVVAAKSEDADYAQMAEEYYLTHKKEFTTQPIVSVTHVMIGIKERTDAEAKELATEVYEKATRDGADFEALVAEYSDDPAAPKNKGHYKDTPVEGFVAPFAQAVRGLEPGEISEPVKTIYGYHVIRLDERQAARQQSFEEVKEKLIQRMEKEHAEDIRNVFLQGLIQDNPIEANPETVELLRQAYGEPSTP